MSIRVSILFFVVLCSLPVVVLPQTPPLNLPVFDPEIAREKEWQDIRKHLNALETIGRDSDERRRIILDAKQAVLTELYRRSSAEELRLLAPDNQDRLRFDDFLKQNNTGLIKLVVDLGCDEYSVRRETVQLCGRFSMPGGGSAYSFRQNDYQIWKLADLLYDGKSFFAFGQMSQGFLVNIGDIPLKDVTSETNGLGLVFSFVPNSDFASSVKQNIQFADGIRDHDFDYRKVLAVVEGNTYVLRSIAFKGNVIREEDGSKYNELDFDKRKDVIVAFRVLRKDFNGTVTLLWKILESKLSPVLKLPK